MFWVSGCVFVNAGAVVCLTWSASNQRVMYIHNGMLSSDLSCSEGFRFSPFLALALWNCLQCGRCSTEHSVPVFGPLSSSINFI
jgi:hypothetical protein